MKAATPLLALGVLGAVWALGLPARANPVSPVKGGVHHVVFELTSDNPAVWTVAVNNIQNTQKAFGADHTELELVAHGPGIGIMLKTNAVEAARMQQLASNHVAFAACNNTMHARHLTGDDLLPFVTVVPSGVGEVILKQEAGWVYLKSGL